MKILFLTPQNPYPAISGGLIKTLKTVEYLSKNHDVEIGFFAKTTSSNERINIEKLNQLFNVKVFTRYLNLERTGVNYLKSLIHNVPLSIYRNSSKDFKKDVEVRLAKVDIIFVDHFLMFQYVPRDFKKKVILHQHNAEFVMWKRFAEVQNNYLKKIVANLESIRIKKYEQKIIERANVVLASPNDIALLASITTKRINFVETFHLGEDYLLNEPALKFDKTSFKILYIGTLTWEANREGLLWFLKNIWPIVLKKIPDIKFEIIGKDNNPEYFKEWTNTPQVTWHGFVEDLAEHYSNCRVFIAPLNFGSGIKVKVVNALYRGMPTVTTTIGVEGLNLQNGVDIYYSDDYNTYADYVIDLLTNQKKWEEMSTSSRKIAIEQYSWNRVFKLIDQAISND